MFKTLEILASVATIVGFAFIYCQLRLQIKKDRIELILKLSADFFNNNKFMSIFKILDSNRLDDCNKSIKLIISGNEINKVDGNTIDKVEEVDLNSYMNFFNSLAILVEEKIVSQSDVMKLFRYQLEKTFASIEMIKYMEEYGFDRIKILLPKGFFFYGSLKDSNSRYENPDIAEVIESLRDRKFQKLYGYRESITGSNNEYKAIIKSNNVRDFVNGRFVEICNNVSWSKLIETLDIYEEVDVLYLRTIIQIKKSKEYVWVYLKK